ncbi:hypothetical protein O0L34_g10507 [Tuta absoluta]|nr:hypothetical protein O0L34_g10507 [Tuta absoluta]
MVCKTFEHLRRKQQHCSQQEHLENLSRCRVREEHQEYFIRQVDDKLYHCGHCNNLQMIHEIDDHVEKEHPRKKPNNLVSDAKKHPNSPAKQLANSPAKHRNEAKNVQNNKNCANNNITQPEPAVIKKISYEEFINSFKNRSANKDNTVENSNAIKNNDKTINNHIINDQKLNHEKHVTNNNSNNKIPVITRNDNHHATNTKNNSTSTINNNISVTNTKNSIQKSAKTENHNGVAKTDYSRPFFDYITIFPFGYNITVPWFSYNIVCVRPNDYYCGLCDVAVPGADILDHMYGDKHMELLHRTPFIAPFSYNLIRAIRDALHCAICNVLVTVADIYKHIDDPEHKENVHKALNHHANPKPPQIGDNMSYVPEKSLENNNGHIHNSNIINSNTKTPNILDQNVANLKTSAENNIINESTENDEEYNDICEDIDRTFESISSEDVSFDEEEHVYLKLKNSYIKISNTSYNTLVHNGDGSRYCFVCAESVQYVELQKHVYAREHLENIDKYMFLDKYEDHLLRQLYLMYHCGICNVIITRKELKAHLEWPVHTLQNDNLKNNKKTKKTEIKGGVKPVSTTKEYIYLHENEPKIKICLNVEVTDKTTKNVEIIKVPEEEGFMKNKIIIFNDNVLKVSWESWHAIAKVKNGYKCNLCQRELHTADIKLHCTSECHRYCLDKPFEKQYAPALIRKINDSTLNCVFCNTEISNKEHLVTVHVNGKKHQKKYEDILKESSVANTYTDCNDDVLML